MGALCEKEQAPIQSKRCYKCQENSQSLHVFQQCYHQICYKCIPSSTQLPLKCPIPHNNLANLGRQLYNSVRKFNQDTQLCSKKHKMIWRDEFSLCSICKIHLHGYKCRVCNEIKCTLCSKSFDAKKQKCPNKHSIIWRSVQIPCLICGLKKHGWSCKDCRWYACSECCDTRYNMSGCPNLHSLNWKNFKDQCTICKIKSHCFSCEQCSCNFCVKCTNYEFNKNYCPNKHKTELTSKNVCIKCELELPGMSCIECNYHFCSKCDLDKYSTNVKNKPDAYASIRIVIENPLLQFEQFQQKSSLNLIKQATDRLNKRPTLSIEIENSSLESEIKSTNNLIEIIKKEIEQDPEDISLYVKLIDIYKQMESYIEEIQTYIRILQTYFKKMTKQNKSKKENPNQNQKENEKQKQQQKYVLQIGCTGLQRAIEMKFIKSSILLLDNLLELGKNSQYKQLFDQKTNNWKLKRIEQILLSNQTQLAKDEFQKIQERGEEYERIKCLFEDDGI